MPTNDKPSGWEAAFEKATGRVRCHDTEERVRYFRAGYKARDPQFEEMSHDLGKRTQELDEAERDVKALKADLRAALKDAQRIHWLHYGKDDVNLAAIREKWGL